MSNALKTLLTESAENPNFRQQFASDMEGVMSRYHLSDSEKELVRNKDYAGMKSLIGDTSNSNIYNNTVNDDNDK